MNKYEFKKELKNLVREKGISFIKNNPTLRKQWNAIIEADEDWNNDIKTDEEAQYDAAQKLFDVDGAFANIDARDFKSYMNSIYTGNEPQTPLWDFYKHNRPVENIRDDFSNASDIGPQEMTGQTKNPNFYNLGHKDAWAGTEFIKNDDGSINKDRGLQYVLDNYGVTQDEFMKMLVDEQKKYSRNKIWDLDDPTNWKNDTYLGMDLSGDGFLDRAMRSIIKWSADNFWKNTQEDYRNGIAQEDPGYGIGGLNTGDVVFNTADVVTSPITMGKTKALKVLGGIGGIGSDVAIPVTRELYNSEHNGTDYDVFNAGKEAMFRLGGRGVGNAGQLLDGLSKASKDVSPTLSTKLHNLDEAAHGQQMVDERWNALKDNLRKEAEEQIKKPWHIDWFGDNDKIVINRPLTGINDELKRYNLKQNEHILDNGDILTIKNDKVISRIPSDMDINPLRTPSGIVRKNRRPVFQSFNRDDFANPEFFKVIDENDGIKYVNNILEDDYKDMKMYIENKYGPEELRKENEGLTPKEIEFFDEYYSKHPDDISGLTSADISRIDELKSKYPEFKDKYSYKKVNSTGEGIVRGLDRLNDDGLVKYATRVVASREPETIDVDNMKYNIRDMAKVEELYSTIPAEKRELARQGDYSTLNEREKRIVKKYYELKALSNYNVNFDN